MTAFALIFIMAAQHNIRILQWQSYKSQGIVGTRHVPFMLILLKDNKNEEE